MRHLSADLECEAPSDDVAPPVLSERYRDTGVKLGKSIRLLKLDGKDHEIFLDPGVFAALAPMLD